ncbi:uncharacterized protein LOC120326360 [Styela clava]
MGIECNIFKSLKDKFKKENNDSEEQQSCTKDRAMKVFIFSLASLLAFASFAGMAAASTFRPYWHITLPSFGAFFGIICPILIVLLKKDNVLRKYPHLYIYYVVEMLLISFTGIAAILISEFEEVNVRILFGIILLLLGPTAIYFAYKNIDTLRKVIFWSESELEKEFYPNRNNNNTAHAPIFFFGTDYAF